MKKGHAPLGKVWLVFKFLNWIHLQFLGFFVYTLMQMSLNTLFDSQCPGHLHKGPKASKKTKQSTTIAKILNVLCGMAEMNFVALNSLTKECVSRFKINAWWVYFHLEQRSETVRKYVNDTHSLRIRVALCHLLFFAPPADLIPTIYLNSPFTHKAIVGVAGGWMLLC